MSDPMADALDKMLADATEKVEGSVEVAPEAAPVEVDPLAHLIGGANPDADRDPFEMMLEGMLEGAVEDEDAQRKRPEYEEHEWEFKSTIIFEEDDVQVVCKKCFRQMRMPRTSTTNEAMASHQVNPDCGLGTIGEVMDS